MKNFTVDEVAIPLRLGTPEAADFVETVAVRNAVEEIGYGSDDFSASPEDLLPNWQNQEFEPKRLLAARVGGRIVARGVYETRPGEAMDAAWALVEVLPEFRGRGIGSAVAGQLESLAVADGKSRLLVYAVSPEAPGERLPSPTGFGSVPLSNPEVQFLLHRGYSLEQVERGSRLALPVDGLEQAVADAEAASGSDYRMHYWVDRTPERWREDIAFLLTRMSTDAPTAGLEEPEDPWSVERLVADEEKSAEGPRTAVTAAVEHVPSGRLVGFTELDVPGDRERPANQEDTIVLKEHRGHRLGMLLKAGNLLHLQRVRPGHPAVITFNAEENRHMLSVNEALGFVPVCYEGAWKKVPRPQ